MQEQKMNDTLDKLCELSRLKLTEEEKARFHKDFARMVAFIDKVAQLQLKKEDIPPIISKEKMHLADDVPANFPLPDGFKRDYRVGGILEEE